MAFSNRILYVGVNDHDIDLFEGQYIVPNGMSYNSYLLMEDKIAVMDTVDRRFTHEWLDNIAKCLSGRRPDYLVIQHMEPDHSANILSFLKVYPDVRIVTSAKALVMMKNFYGEDFSERAIVIADGDVLELGEMSLHFVGAPMVHWPEVVMTYESTEKVLFSADGFGKFGALDAEEDWACEARRYYFGIVGNTVLRFRTF
ncbi:MAG: MBL fold metallo-hydrolase [Clostridia bacterium]|nr:MBL fold metallo-hydrolase [Clostridia bacterium]